MNRPPMPLATAKPAALLSTSRQLVLYLLAGVAAPAVIWMMLGGVTLAEPLVQFTLVQIALANIAAWRILARLRTYARARLLSYVLPVNSVTFGAMVAVNSVLRLNYSTTLFAACLLSTLAVSYLVTARIRHANPTLSHYIVPGGQIGSALLGWGFKELPSPAVLRDLIDEKQISGSVIADLHHDHSAEWEALLAYAALQGIPVYHYWLIEEALTGEVRIDRLRENELGSLIPNLPYMAGKRVFDLVSAALALVLLAPLMLLLAIAIRVDSSGPAIFIQKRIGFRGQTFRMIKFRTMADDNAVGNTGADRDHAITQEFDARITRIGRFLRRFRLDELPQIWNIVKGEMSWIGPRPEASSLSDWYATEIPFYAYRHIVRPGLTGWAQVNQGHVADLDSIQAKLRLDFYYVKNLSLWLDILIAMKTLRVLAQGIGAK